MRLKGPGIFWHEEVANAMLMLRSYHKAGRWDLLKNTTFSGALLSVRGAHKMGMRPMRTTFHIGEIFQGEKDHTTSAKLLSFLTYRHLME